MKNLERCCRLPERDDLDDCEENNGSESKEQVSVAGNSENRT